MSDKFQALRLDFNPFEPAATGPPIAGPLSPPNELAERAKALLNVHQTGQGVKAIVVVGGYGCGKTCLLQWLHSEILPLHRIKSFYFDNPGVQFYDLANALLRTIGRKDFAKFIWEFAGPEVSHPYQQDLFRKSFEEYLIAATGPRRSQYDITIPLQDAIIATEITEDGEIAHCLARIVSESVSKPYFEYRDFVPRQSGSMVPEKEEAQYFRAILKTIVRGSGASAIAFLIDEFEEIGLQKRLSKRAAHDYLATMKRLINLTQSEQLDFWVVLSMTPDAYERTVGLEPALAERFSGNVQALTIEAIDLDDAIALMKSRLDSARSGKTEESHGALFPFPDDVFFRPNTFSNPRRLVKACFRAIALANADVHLPFTEAYLHKIEDELFPSAVDTRERNGE